MSERYIKKRELKEYINILREQEEVTPTSVSTWESGITVGPANRGFSMSNTWESGASRPPYLFEKNKEQEIDESKWYNTVLDLVGIADPTGFVDTVNAASYFSQGDYLYGFLSVVSVLPYAGDLVAKPIVGILKGTGAASKINKAVKAGKGSPQYIGAVKELKKLYKKYPTLAAAGKKVSGVEDVERTLRYMEKVPSLRKWKADTKTIFSIFGDAAKISKATGKTARIFSKGGLLTKMQRRGLLNRLKIYNKFTKWLLGAGSDPEELSEEEMEQQFETYLQTDQSKQDFNEMPIEDQEEFVNVLGMQYN